MAAIAVPSQAQQTTRGAVAQQGASAGATSGVQSGSTTTGGADIAQGPAAGPGVPNRASEGPGPQARPRQPTEDETVVDRVAEGQTVNPFSAQDPCVDVGLGGIPESERFGARNRARLDAVERLLAPGFVAGRSETGRQIIADYQEEVSKRHPDAAVAGAYLGVVSTVSITPQVVAQVNRVLCVSTPKQLAAQIAAKAMDVRSRTR